MAQPPAPPGWYPDPEQPQTQRYWDGDDWTDQRAPLTEDASSALEMPPRLLVAGLGGLIAVIGVFLPWADTEGGLPLAGNSLIQHTEGVLVVVFALAGVVTALQSQPGWRIYTFIAGALLIGLAVLAGTNMPIEYRNQLSEVAAGQATPGAGIWTVGVGGALVALSAFVGLDSSSRPPGADANDEGNKHDWGRWWNELMSGQRQDRDD